MNISFENPDKINGLMTITVEEADYREEVEKNSKGLSQACKHSRFPSRASSYGVA